MRKRFVKVVTELLEKDERVVLLLGDIGVHGFRDAFQRFPTRVYNVGILEQATVGMAAGLAMSGLVPIVHTIAPFLVERAYEQLKIDFGYQQLRGIFVSVGASYDYASLGCTHHCPADVSLIENIEGFDIVVPCCVAEVDKYIKAAVDKPGSTYIRLPEHPQAVFPEQVKFADEEVLIVGIGPVSDMVFSASSRLPVQHYFQSTVKPFKMDYVAERLKGCVKSIIVVEPYYSSHLTDEIRDFAERYADRPVTVKSFSIPRRFYRGYGSVALDSQAFFTAADLRKTIQQCLH